MEVIGWKKEDTQESIRLTSLPNVSSSSRARREEKTGGSWPKVKVSVSWSKTNQHVWESTFGWTCWWDTNRLSPLLQILSPPIIWTSFNLIDYWLEIWPSVKGFGKWRTNLDLRSIIKDWFRQAATSSLWSSIRSVTSPTFGCHLSWFTFSLTRISDWWTTDRRSGKMGWWLIEDQISDGLAFQPQLIIEDLSGKNLWNERINLHLPTRALKTSPNVGAQVSGFFFLFYLLQL